MHPSPRGILLGLLCSLFAASLSAQASRTWISGVGDDANPGSRTAPCKTWAGAISRTAAGGEIDALDPGGFGALTITKAITLDGGGGQVASILVSGTNGITVNAGPSDVVVLRNLRFNGIGTGLDGIRFNSGKALIIKNCFIDGFISHGIYIDVATTAYVTISNTTITGASTAAMYDGINVDTVSSTAKVVLDRVRVLNSPHVGLFFQAGRAVVRNSVITGGNYGVAVYNGSVQISDSDISDNSNGVKTYSGNLTLSGCTITGNTVGTTISGGAITSYGNNDISGNTSGNGPLSGSVAPQ